MLMGMSLRCASRIIVAPSLLALVLVAQQAAASNMGERMAANVAGVEDKVIDLAEAIPESKYGWAPSDEVRSVSEVLGHIASANHFLAARMAGGDPPAGSGEWEKTVTTRADAVEKLKESFAALKKALAGADFDKPTKLFGGQEGTVGDLGLLAVGHGHQHLGQLIAYARANQVTPPWSE